MYALVCFLFHHEVVNTTGAFEYCKNSTLRLVFLDVSFCIGWVFFNHITIYTATVY